MLSEGCDRLLSFTDVEAELIDAVRMSWRLPGGGRWPFASDAPWHLMTREARADGAFDAWRKEREEQIAREMRNVAAPVPLTAEEVDWMNARLDWLRFAPERDRKLVAVVLALKAGEAGRVTLWRRVRDKLRRSPAWAAVAGGDRGLGMRYSRAVAAITRGVNALPGTGDQPKSAVSLG